jgi:DNA polymerase III subunit beta
MKFKISSNLLLAMLSTVSSVIKGNPVLPILSTVVISIKKNKLTLKATDLNATVLFHADVEADSDFIFCADAKMLIETMKLLKDEIVTIIVSDKNDKVEVKSSKGVYKMQREDYEDYPERDQQKMNHIYDISSDELSDVIDKTTFAASRDELRPSLTGVFFSTSKKSIEIACTDAHKLSKVVVDVNTKIDHSMIVPAKYLSKLDSILKSRETETIKVFVSANYVVFKIDDIEFEIRLIDAKYVDYNAVIPQFDEETENVVSVNKNDLTACLKRLGVYANKHTNETIFRIKNKLTILTRDLDRSLDASEEIVFEHTGIKEQMTIGLNYKFLIDVISKIKSENVLFYITSPRRAIVIKDESVENKDSLFLVMPTLINVEEYA